MTEHTPNIDQMRARFAYRPDAPDAYDPEWAEEFDRGLAAHDKRQREKLLAPGNPDARMSAYYYGFEPTGVGIIDGILSAVATAGKHFHSTDMWADEPEPHENWRDMSEEQRIQQAANVAAAAIREASDD